MWKKQWIGQGKGLHIYILLFSCWLNHYSTRHMNCFWRGHNGASRLIGRVYWAVSVFICLDYMGSYDWKGFKKVSTLSVSPVLSHFEGFLPSVWSSGVKHSSRLIEVRGLTYIRSTVWPWKKKKNLIDCFGCVCVRVGLLSCCAGLKLGTTLNLKWSRVWGLKAAAQWHNDLTTRAYVPCDVVVLCCYLITAPIS